jgi:hypothetical protein
MNRIDICVEDYCESVCRLSIEINITKDELSELEKMDSDSLIKFIINELMESKHEI